MNIDFRIPDYVFPGDKYGIPVLDKGQQAEAIEPPFNVWGSRPRSMKHGGTNCFYTHDYKFSALWKHPEALIVAGCGVSVEANFSTSDVMPFAVGIYYTFAKRWLARFWQKNGIRIIVDLNVSEKFMNVNMIGVPRGWKSYATRAQKGSNILLPKMYRAARKRAGEEGVMFLVYGGGEKIEKMCNENNWIWIPERMREIKEKYYG